MFFNYVFRIEKKNNKPTEIGKKYWRRRVSIPVPLAC